MWISLLKEKLNHAPAYLYIYIYTRIYFIFFFIYFIFFLNQWITGPHWENSWGGPENLHKRVRRVNRVYCIQLSLLIVYLIRFVCRHCSIDRWIISPHTFFRPPVTTGYTLSYACTGIFSNVIPQNSSAIPTHTNSNPRIIRNCSDVTSVQQKVTRVAVLHNKACILYKYKIQVNIKKIRQTSKMLDTINSLKKLKIEK